MDAKKLTLLGVIVGGATSFTAIGGAVVMWEDVRPWMSNAEKLEQHDRACESILWTIQTDLFNAQSNEVNALERQDRLTDPDALVLNRNIISQAKKAQQLFKDKLEFQKERCKEGRDRWD